MTKNKLKQIISSIIVATLIFCGTTTSTLASTASTALLHNQVSTGTYLKETNEDIKYWADRFNSYNELLESGELSELVGTSSVYVKYTEDENEEITSEVKTEEEYEQEIIEDSISTLSSIGSFECDQTSWLRLDLQVYSSNGGYSAISFWEWKTTPICRFTDVNTIAVSEGLIIGSGTKAAEYRAYDTYYNEYFYQLPLVYSQYGNAIGSTANLVGDSELTTMKYHMGMTLAPVEWNNSSATQGRIYTSYVHKQVALGSPSFDLSGSLSFGLELSTDESSGSLLVVR